MPLHPYDKTIPPLCNYMQGSGTAQYKYSFSQIKLGPTIETENDKTLNVRAQSQNYLHDKTYWIACYEQ